MSPDDLPIVYFLLTLALVYIFRANSLRKGCPRCGGAVKRQKHKKPGSLFPARTLQCTECQHTPGKVKSRPRKRASARD